MSQLTPRNRTWGERLAWEVIGVIDTVDDRAEWSFPAEPGAVRNARAAVRGQLRSWELDSLCDLTALLVSELVTNSLRHATGPIGVRLVRPAGLEGVLLVEVSDPLPDPPRERIAHPEDESGRGLQLVAHSSRRWGTRPDEAGKTVWFELAVPS
ncbi:ATP-binding protein [Streptomyces sp. NPDC047043]|uniref:ATP-binding protein n=1 Tax=Streptomyces sp. NPDC047043 TaxID=3154497 RepID=UPI0033DBCEE6